VAAFEGEIGFSVIESLQLELDKLVVPALVLNMAHIAFGFCHDEIAAMEAGFLSKVTLHILVTGNAQA